MVVTIPPQDKGNYVNEAFEGNKTGEEASVAKL